MQRYAFAVKNNGDPFDRLRVSARNESLKELRGLAEDVVSGALEPSLGVSSSYVMQGRWEEKLERVERTPFTVEEVDASGVPVKKGTNTLANDLTIVVADVPIPPDKLNFKVDLDRTLTVIKVILPVAGGPMEPTGSQASERQQRQRTWKDVTLDYIGRLFRGSSDPTGDGVPNPALRRSDYIHKIAGVARVGLQGTDPSLSALATQSLNSFREEVVALEAGAVKNRYLWRLGWRCLVVAGGSTLAYWLISSACPTDYTHAVSSIRCEKYPLLSEYRNFFVLAAGTAIGTWLSFSVRRVILSFLDLAALEEDRLDPTIRILFITGIASVVGLLFWTKAVTVGIGNFQSDFTLSGTYALLIGLLLGIAERTMATAVSKRAGEFTGAIGGK
jgi:hypothetical protein